MSDQLEIYPYRREKSSEAVKNSKLEWGRPLITKPSQQRKKIKVNIHGFSKNILVNCILLFIFARAELVGGLLPFLPAFYAAAFLQEKKAWLPLTVASCAGVWFFSSGQSLAMSAAVIIALSLTLHFTTRKRDELYVISITVALTVFIIKAIFVFWEGYVFHKVASIAFEGILAGALVPSYLEVLDRFQLSKRKVWNKESLFGLFLLCFAVLVAIGDLSVFSFSVRALISRYFILLLAYNFGSGISTSAGVVLGLVPSMSSIISPQMVGVYALSGLLGGLFRKMGKLMVALGFLLGHFLLSIYITDPWNMDSLLIETSMAIVFFLLTPNIIMDVFSHLFPTNFLWSDDESGKELVTSKLNKLAEVFRELSRTFKQVSAEVEEKENEGLNKLLNSIARKTCKGCAVFGICWQKDINSTYANMKEMFKTVKIKGQLSPEDIPYEIRKRCQRTHELALTVGCLHETYAVNEYWHKKLGETRELVSEQLHGVSGIMKDLACQLELARDVYREKEAQLLNGLQDLGVNVESVDFSELKGGTEIEIIKEPCQKGKMECDTIIKTFAEEMLGEKFAVDRTNCALKNGTLACRCRLLPSSCYIVEVGFAAAQGAGNMVSGDSFWHSPIKGGKHIILLSDGMGIGARANRESNATILLFQQLLNNGFDVETSIKTVNSILSMRSEETFATVDMAIIDLYSGETRFFKIGAAPSFIKRGSAVGIVKASSLPIGIMGSVEVQPLEKKVRPGDIIIMMTDGMLEGNRDLHDKEGWMQSVIREIHEDCADEMADLILKHALAVIDGPVKDDMSIVVARLQHR
ncbi:MAG: stage sporulation protein [Clostridia bacterium]|nr:stage sporulation protein [Clostridiales bacterium]MDK2985349.1 stage sporulation protein [Clostridia bacterium]